ncbi:MAG TPA: hypothetical protein VJZ70_06595, partial [Limnochordia bacterium]|nr:hypothetical protein [Limnochordia bacterium]
MGGPSKRDYVELKVITKGKGTVGIGIEAKESLEDGWSFKRGTVVVLKDEPEEGWHLKTPWQGKHGAEVVSDDEGSWRIFMDGPKEIEAVFSEEEPKLITVTGSVAVEHTFPWAAEDRQVSRGLS